MSDPARIFVAIASYRDTECQWTVADLFAKARHPERVFVGILWQCELPEDQDCFAHPYPRPEQVREQRVSYKEARGACWAKRHALDMRAGEEYVLMIDSHMRFAPDWDEGMLEVLAACPTPRAMLSTYPAAYTPPNHLSYSTPYIVPGKNLRGVPLQKSVPAELKAPRPSPFIAGGYLFAPAALFDEVPYDPSLYFSGEEISFALRAFTRGWDAFAPHRCLIHHYYGRLGGAKHWQDQKLWHERDRLSMNRLRHLLGLSRRAEAAVVAGLAEGPYGLGEARSQAQFEHWGGVYLAARVHGEGAFARAEGIPQPRAGGYGAQTPHSTAGKVRQRVCRHGSFLFPLDDLYIGRSLDLYGEWAQAALGLMQDLLQAGDTVVDAGACLGTHTVALARWVGEQGEVLAFEPDPAVFNLLSGNVALNQLTRVRSFQVALGAQADTVWLPVRDFEAADNYGLVRLRLQRDGDNQVAVLRRRLDDFHLPKLQLLKLHACGEELAVLQGARQTLQRTRAAVLVTADRAAHVAGLVDELTAQGYRLWWFESPFFAPDNYYLNTDDAFQGLVGIHLLALPEGREPPRPLMAVLGADDSMAAARGRRASA